MTMIFDSDTASYYDDGSGMGSGSSVPQESYSSGIDFGGWGTTLQGIATLGAQTYAQQTLMQTNQAGQRYIEGQRMAMLQNSIGFPVGNLVLIGGAVLLFMMLKG